MVDNEFEFELVRAGYTQSDTPDAEVDPLEKTKDWYLLYPETVQDANTPGTSQPTLNSVPSFDAVAEVCSLTSTSESETSSSSEPSSDSAKPGKPAKSRPKSRPVMSSPPAQVMERDEAAGYDPGRIPASVFARSESSSAPTDWSIASSDSLFSLQVGNTSISREQALVLSGELERLTRLSKEGELSPKGLKELRKLAGLARSGDHRIMSSSPPVPAAVSINTISSRKLEQKGKIQAFEARRRQWSTQRWTGARTLAVDQGEDVGGALGGSGWTTGEFL